MIQTLIPSQSNTQWQGKMIGTDKMKDSFLDLERHRKQLEDNVEKLRASLRHWQLWEAEYEGLKEEILAIPSPTKAQLATIHDEHEGFVVTKKEVAELLGTDRTPSQVINLIDRRLDYVEQNVRTVQKQLDTAEKKLATATIVSDPVAVDEDGLPISEILEELDEDDNVISGRVNTPGSAKSELLEVLGKVGVELDNNESAAASTQLAKTNSESNKENKSVELGRSSSSPVKTSKPEFKPKPSTKKAVAFTEDTKSGPGEATDSKSYVAKRLETIIAKAEEDAKPSTTAPVIPENESIEDAALRREMLKYGMSEVGAVVAELDMEEGEGSDWTEGEDWNEDDDSDEEEDQWGRSTGQLVDEQLRERMLELEQKLGVRSMQNVGKEVDPDDYDVVQEGIGRISINRDTETSEKTEEQPTKSNLKVGVAKLGEVNSAKSVKKSVNFADELDIAPNSEPSVVFPTVPETTNTVRGVAPVGDIIERTPTSTPTLSNEVQPPKKQSRFKSSRTNNQETSSTTSIAPKVANGPLSHPSASKMTLRPVRSSESKPFSQPIIFQSSSTDNPRTVPTGPEDAILSSKIVERETPSDAEVKEPDEFDPHLLNQEVAMEYHKMRNKFIAREGGFMRDEESEIVPLPEEEGGPRKMSRFKAARLGM